MQNKIFAALVLAGVCTSGFAAESSVTLYGIVDMGYSYRTDNYDKADLYSPAGVLTRPGVKSRSGFDSGQAAGTRLGVRGSEQLMPGIDAIFTLEAGINADTGAAGQGALAWGRESTVGLNIQGTTIKLGRQFSPIYAIYAANEPFALGTVGQASNVIKNISKYTRLDNSLVVNTPYFGNVFAVDAAYSMRAAGNEEIGNNTTTAAGAAGATAAANGSQYGAIYGKLKFADRFFIIGGFNQAKAHNLVPMIATTGDYRDQSYRAWDVLGAADFGFARFTLGYENVKDGLTRATSWKRNSAGMIILNPNAGDALTYNRIHAGAKVPLGNFTLLASYNYSKDKQDMDLKAQQISLGGLYAFSKRTDVYAAYSKITTGDGLTSSSGYDVGDATQGNGAAAGNGYRSGLNVGLRHRF